MLELLEERLAFSVSPISITLGGGDPLITTGTKTLPISITLQ